jgi:hypothetical protein
MLEWLSTAIGLPLFASPPFLLGWAWWRFYRSRPVEGCSRWRNSTAWLAIVSTTGFFLGSFVAAVVLPCNVDRFGWSCLAKWDAFTRYQLWTLPAFVCLAIFGRKGTRIQLISALLAVTFDCVVISSTA